MSPPSDMKKPLHRCNGEGATDQAASKQLISDRSLPVTWFKIDDPGTDYTRVSVDVPNDYVLDVLSAVRACMPATERPAHDGSSPESGCGAGESAPAAEVGMDAAHEPGEEAGGKGAAVISVALSVPRGGLATDMRWPAPNMTVLSLCDLVVETMADLRAAETAGGEAL